MIRGNMKLLKILLISVVSFIAVIYILFILAPVIVSPVLNSKSGMVTSAIKESTGFEATLDGITLVTSWNLSAGVKVKEFKLTVPNADKPFFYAKDTGLKLSLLPLLHKKIQLDSLFSDAVYADIIVKKDGSLQLLDYLPEQKGKPKESFNLPMGIKLSNNLPSICVNTYRIAVIDKRTDHSYFMEGNDFKVTNFVLDKRVKFSTKGKLVFNDTTVSKYDIKLDNRIMPNIQLHDLVFPEDVVVETEQEQTVLQNSENTFSLSEYIDILEKINQNKLAANITTDIKIEGQPKHPKLNGHLKLDGVTVAVDKKLLPASNLDMIFKNHKTEISSVLYTSDDKHEVTSVNGAVNSGKNPDIDLSVKSNAKFQNIIDLADSIASSFNIKELNTLSATGRLNADFNIKSDFKNVNSNGYLKVEPSSLYYGLYNVSIKDITADVDLKNNDIHVNKAGFSIFGQPLKLAGTILSDTTTDLKLTADRLSVKGLLLALGQTAILKEYNINSGLLSLNAILKGKLLEIKPDVSLTVTGLNAYNKPADAKVTLSSALIKILYDGKAASGDVDVNSLGVNIPGANISVPKALVIVSPDVVNIKNSYVMLNNSRIDITGNVKDYLNDKMAIDIKAVGALQSAGIAAFLPKEFRTLISYKGQIPVKAVVTGNAKVQNIVADVTADPNNYIALVDVSALKGQKTKIHSNIELNGDTLTLTNTNLSNSKTTLATVSGGVDKLYSSPKLNLNISVPNNISFPIWGLAHSNITALGSVAVTGDAMNPSMKGSVKVSDISLKDMDFAISDLVADLSGTILNGTATAKKFKFGGIIATDLAGKFSLKDYTKFYLTDATGKSFDGNVSGKLSYDIPTAKIGTEFTGSGLNSTKAVEGAVGIKNALTGSMGFSGKLNMQGVTDKEIIQSLKGNLTFNVDNGRFVSIGRLENLVAAQNVTSNSILKAAISSMSTLSTVQEADRFKSITGEMTFLNGIATLNDIKVSGPLMAYYVKGTYNILQNSANLVILGRLESKVVSVIGPLGQLSADKLLSYIPKIGAATANLLNQLTSDPKNENTSLIPLLSGGSTSYKDFKVIFNGPVGGTSSVKSFKWLSKCDTTEMNLKLDLQNAQQAVKDNINSKIEDTKTKVENVKTNVTNTVETQKAKVEQAKKDVEHAKEDIKAIKENTKQSVENLKNLFNNALKNSQQKIQTTPTATEAQTQTETKKVETVKTDAATNTTVKEETTQKAPESATQSLPSEQAE